MQGRNFVPLLGVISLSAFVLGSCSVESIKSGEPSTAAGDSAHARLNLLSVPGFLNPSPAVSSGVQTHPRLYGDRTFFQELSSSSKVSGTRANKLYSEVRTFANSLTEEVVDNALSPPGVRYRIEVLRPSLDYFGRPVLLSNARVLLSRIYSLGIAYQVESDSSLKARYFKRAWAELSRWAGVDGSGLVTTWNPSHFLDVAELAHAVGIGYDLFHGAMSTTQRNQLATAIKNWALDEALLNWYPSNSPSAWPNSQKSNWNTICNAGLGIAALAIYDNPIAASAAGSVLKNSLYSIQNSLRNYSSAGGWEEGGGYWDYATKYAVTFIIGLRNSFNNDFGLLSISNFRKSGDFAMGITGPTLKIFNYGDTSDTIYSPQLFAFSRWNNKPSLASLQNAFDNQDKGSGVFWFDKPMEVMTLAEGAPLHQNTDPQNVYFPREEVVSLRSGWNSQASFVAVKGGFVGADHGTMNIGTFVYDALGERFITQLGKENYALPGYWDFKQTGLRWNYYRTRAEGNNTLVLNPSADGGQDVTKTASVIKSTLTSVTSPRTVINMTSVYSRQASRLMRGVRLFLAHAEDGSVPKGLLVQDEITMPSAGTAHWSAHTMAAISQGTDLTRARLTLNGKSIEVRVLSPQGAVLRVKEAVGGPNSPVYVPATSTAPVPASNAAFRKLVVELNVPAGVTQTLRVQFAPYSSTGASPWNVNLNTLDSW